MKIESYKIYKVSIPTRRRHTWASSTADVGQGWVILEVKTDDGIVGYGEATTMPEWGGDFGRYYRWLRVTLLTRRKRYMTALTAYWHVTAMSVMATSIKL